MNTEILNKFMELMEMASERGAEKVIRKLQKEKMLPDNMPTYTFSEAQLLHLKGEPFTKVSPATLIKWEKEEIIKNYGSPRNKKYREDELIEAMKNKGRRKHDLAA
jgi:hypothetical protein